jgi:hypothetical protein
MAATQVSANMMRSIRDASVQSQSRNSPRPMARRLGPRQASRMRLVTIEVPIKEPAHMDTINSPPPSMGQMRRTLSMKSLTMAKQVDPNFGNAEGSDPKKENVAVKKARSFTEEVIATRSALASRDAFLIDPQAKFMRHWDIVTLIALLFTATFTPYEVAVRQTALDVAFVVNRIVDCIFIWDMGMQFFLMYRLSAQKGGGWVRDRKMIVRHYLRGWFSIDLISILPFDVVAWAMQDGALGKMKVLRIIRLMRLLKLVRIMRASRIFKRWETSISISYSLLSLIKFLVMIVIVGHWLACAWALLHETVCDEQCTEDRGPEKTWLNAWLSSRPGVMPSPHDRYTLAMYWSIMTLTSIGYGDITAQSYLEYAVSTFFMLIGAICWAYIIGCTCGIVATLDMDTAHFRQTMDQLNQFLRDNCVPYPLRRQLRGYFHQAKSLQKHHASQDLIEQMSPKLKGQVAMCTYGSIVEQLFGGVLFESAEPDFIVEIAQQFESAVFAPNELLDEPDVLYMLVRGVVVLGGRVLSNGAMWGEDMVLSCVEYQDTHAAMSLTYVEVKILSKSALMETAEYFPKAAAAMRRCVAKLAARRGLLHEAKKMKVAKEDRVKATAEATADGVPLDTDHQKRRRSSMSSRRGSSKLSVTSKDVQAIIQTEMQALASPGGSNGGASPAHEPVQGGVPEPTTPRGSVMDVLRLDTVAGSLEAAIGRVVLELLSAKSEDVARGLAAVALEQQRGGSAAKGAASAASAGVSAVLAMATKPDTTTMTSAAKRRNSRDSKRSAVAGEPGAAHTAGAAEKAGASKAPGAAPVPPAAADAEPAVPAEVSAPLPPPGTEEERGRQPPTATL